MGAVMMRGGGASAKTGMAAFSLNDTTPTFEIPMEGAPSGVLVWVSVENIAPIVLTQSYKTRTLIIGTNSGWAVASLDETGSALILSRSWDGYNSRYTNQSGTVFWLAIP